MPGAKPMLTIEYWQKRRDAVGQDLRAARLSIHPSRDKDCHALASYIQWLGKMQVQNEKQLAALQAGK